MRSIVTFFVKYPIWANAIIATVMVIGALSYMFGLKKSFFPEREPRNITISVVYPGASPEEVEEGVTIKIEEAIKTLQVAMQLPGVRPTGKNAAPTANSNSKSVELSSTDKLTMYLELADAHRLQDEQV